MTRFLPLLLLAALLVPGAETPARAAAGVQVKSATSALELREENALVKVRAQLSNASSTRRDVRLGITLISGKGKRTFLMSRPVKDLPARRTTLVVVKGLLPDVVAGQYDVEVCVSDIAGRGCRVAAQRLKVPGPQLKITTYTDFGYVNNGELRYGGVYVTNEGVGAVSFSKPTRTGDEGFRMQQRRCDDALGRGDRCSVSLDFRATKVGSYEGTLRMSVSNGRTIVVPLSAIINEGPAEMVFSPASHDFGQIAEDGPDATFDFTITNVGEGTGGFTSYFSEGNWSFDAYDCNDNLEPGESCTFTVIFQSEDDPGTYASDVGIKHWRGSARAHVTGEIVAS